MSKGGKLKTNKSTAKRFRRTSSGKFKKMGAGKRHLAANKSRKNKRHARESSLVTNNSSQSLRRLMPYA